MKKLLAFLIAIHVLLWSTKMVPAFARFNTRNKLIDNIIILSNSSMRSIVNSYCKDLTSSEFRPGVRATGKRYTAMSSFFKTIMRIVHVGSQKQMSWIHAWGRIAPMERIQSFWNWPNIKNPCHSMRSFISLALRIPEIAVAAATGRSYPKPTTRVRFWNPLFIKSLFERFSKFGILIRHLNPPHQGSFVEPFRCSLHRFGSFFYNIKLALFATLFVVAFCGQAWATTYYLRSDGTVTAANKANATSCSSASTAMNITQHNAATFAAGDTIVLCDTGTPDPVLRDAILTPPSSGSSGAGNSITYTNSGSPIVSGSNLLAAGWSASVTTLPTLTSSTIPSAGTSISLLFSENVQFGAGGNAGWTLSMSGGASSMTYSSGSGTSTLVFTLGRTILSTETGTIAYVQPGNGVEDTNPLANNLASLSGATVTNDSTTTTFTVTAAGVSNGSCSCTSPVNPGNTTTCSCAPSTYYVLNSATSDTCGGTVSDSTITTSAVTSNCTVTAQFAYDFTAAGATNPISWWDFQEASSPSKDGNATNGNDLAWSGTAARITLSGATALTGFTYALDIPTSQTVSRANANLSSNFPGKGATSAMTVVGRIYFPSSTAAGNIFDITDSSTKGWRLDLVGTSPGTLYFDSYTSIGTNEHAYSNSTLATGTWYSIGGVWDGSTLYAYVNGVQQTHTASMASINLDSTDALKFYHAQEMYVVEWAVFSGALTSDQMLSIHNYGLNGLR